MGEAVAVAEFSKKRIPVYIPFGQNTACDMMVIINNKIIRIQCKTTEKIKENGTMQFDIARTNGFTKIKRENC